MLSDAAAAAHSSFGISMKIVAARTISIVAHPFVLLLLLVFLPIAQLSTRSAFNTTLIFSGIVLAPLSFLIWRSFSSGAWRTVDASDKENRPSLYTTAIFALCAAGAYFFFIDRSPDIVLGCLVSLAMILVAAGLNRWIKISLHVTFACFCGILLARVRLVYGVPVLLLLPPLIWSRLVLSRHVLSETIFGLLLGSSGAALFLSF